MDNFIHRYGNKKYYHAICSECGCNRGYVPKRHVVGSCSSCAAKLRIDKHGNPMLGRKHKDASKFRKHSHSHYDYSDSLIEYSKSGNKRLKYRKHCPSCGVDMGYHRNVDSNRVCKTCCDKAKTKYTPEQKRIRDAIKANIGTRLRARNSSKNYTSTFSMLPYTFEELIERLESQFQPGMSWNNYGEWHIDHIKPDSWFNYSSYNDKGFLESWSLENLQPLWAKDNMKKGNKYEG